MSEEGEEEPLRAPTPRAARTPARTARKRRAFSRLSMQILLANLTGLLVLLTGVLVLGEMREGLIDARIANLRSQAELIANVLEDAATTGAPTPRLDAARARSVLSGLSLADDAARVRLFDAKGALIADSLVLRDRVRVHPLSPVQKPDSWRNKALKAFDATLRWVKAQPPFKKQAPARLRSIAEEVSLALSGEVVAGERRGEEGVRLVSVSVPVQRVAAVLGVISVDSSDVDAIIAAERRALLPFVIVAALVTLLSTLLVTIMIARPIRKLAIAADQIRHGGSRRAIPNLSARGDEIGDLSQSLEAMTDALYERLDAIESFAADVSHEIKNPLTSIQSAVETLARIDDPVRRKRLLHVLQNDVQRMNRLITDIAISSRLDANLARARAEPVDIGLLLKDIIATYKPAASAGAKPKPPPIKLEGVPSEPIIVYGAESALARVFRNLIDNALSFSPKGGVVRITLEQDETTTPPNLRIIVDDNGPGIPPENLESVFQRFYTDRPQKSRADTHSGLGLAIVRQIINAHRGRIEAQNRDKGGARFTVELPLGPPDKR